MSLETGTQVRIAYKAYATGAITANTEATSSVDPGASSAQILRRVSSTLKLAKATYQSNEIRADHQIADFRHGGRSVTGSITGEYSPATYFDFIEAAFLGTKVAAVSASDSDFTSVTASNSSSEFVFAAGDPVAKGFRVGMILNFTNLATAANNSVNFTITGFGGTSNRTVSVFPAPTDESTPDTSFNVTSVGKQVFVPTSGHTYRKFAFEHYYQTLDYHNLFTECRVSSLKWGLPATGMATFEIGVMGRDMETGSSGSSPFFTSPTAANTNGLFTAVNGLLRVGGSTVGVVTGLNIDLNLNATAPSVVGQNFAPEIFLGRANTTGQFTAMLQDGTLIDDFKNESEIDLLCYMTTTSASNSPANTIYLPRIKLGDAPVGVTGENEQILTIPFQALLSSATTSSTGIEATTIQVCDTAAS